MAETKTLPLIEFLRKNHEIIAITTLALQTANFFTFYLFKMTSLFFTVLFYLMHFVVFVAVKDELQDKPKKQAITMFLVTSYFFCAALCNHLINIVMYKPLLKMPDLNVKPASVFNAAGLLNLATLILFGYLTTNERTREAFKNFLATPILENLGLVKEDIVLKPGDVVLCIDKDTKKPVVIPHKDRYLHTLILGPTGSGKTSQTIIPLLNQDMQNPECGITVIEPKTDLAEKVYAMAKYYGRKVLYFNPILPDCPTFNPLYGKEEDVIENMVTAFKRLDPDSPQYFQDMNEQLLRNALKILKRLEGKGTGVLGRGDAATLIYLYRLITNAGGEGYKMVKAFSRLSVPDEETQKEHMDIVNYFLMDYFKEKSKTYENCSGLRSQVSKITSNKYLRKVLNPPSGVSDIDFDKHLAENGVLAITTAQGKLRDLGSYLGYFIILTFQSSVFKRPGNERTRRPHFLYIDEFQTYSNPGFADMLTQGRSYRVASHLATQNRALIGMGAGKEGKDFLELVSTNARNIVLYPGANAIDAKYYSEQFGEILKKKKTWGESRSKFNPLYGLQKLGYPRESVNYSEELEVRFTPSELIYRPFGEITYCIIKNNTIQTPGVGLISYIPQELNDTLDRMVEEYNKEQEAKMQEAELAEYREAKKEIEAFDGKSFLSAKETKAQEELESVKEDIWEEPKPQKNQKEEKFNTGETKEVMDDDFVDLDDVL